MESFMSSIAEIFLNSLPQNLSIVIGIYAFNKQKIHAKKFWICMLISLVAIFLIRLLPISFGIHTLLGMIVLVFLGVYFLGFPIHKTIRSVFFTTIIILIIEIINMNVLTLIYGAEGFETIMADSLTNAIAGFPASLLLLVTIFVLYIIFTKNVKRGGDDGETGGAIS